jgi:hypothetical protein
LHEDSQLAQPSYAGLTRVSIIFEKTFSRKMGGRVKPGHDALEASLRGAQATKQSSLLRGFWIASLRPQ